MAKEGAEQRAADDAGRDRKRLVLVVVPDVEGAGVVARSTGRYASADGAGNATAERTVAPRLLHARAACGERD
jgi:hypothetical protein